MAKEGVLPSLGPMSGPAGQRQLDEMAVDGVYRIRVESLRDLLEIYERELEMTEGHLARRRRQRSSAPPQALDRRRSFKNVDRARRQPLDHDVLRARSGPPLIVGGALDCWPGRDKSGRWPRTSRVITLVLGEGVLRGPSG